MSEIISVYSTVSQADGFFADVPGDELLQNRYFPTAARDEFVTREVLFDLDQLDLKAGVFVKKGFINGDTTKYYAKNVEPPRVGLSDTIDPKDHDRILFEQICRDMGLDESRDEPLEMLKRLKIARMGKRIKRSIEKSIVDVLINNAVHGTEATSDTDPTPIEIDVKYYKEEDGNPQRFIPKYAWGNGSATPYRDVCAMCIALSNHGGKPQDLLLSPEAWVLLEKDEEFKTMVQTYHSEKSILTGGDYDDAVIVARCVFLGYVLNVIVYNAVYENDAGQMVPYLPKDFVCVLSENCGRTLCGGCNGLDPNAITAENPLQMKTFVQRRGKLIGTQFLDFQHEEAIFRVESRPLPAPRRLWGWITMLAENANSVSGGSVGPAINVLFSTEESGVTLPDDMMNVKGGSSITFSVPSVSHKTCDVYLNGVLKQAQASGSLTLTVPNVDAEITFVYNQIYIDVTFAASGATPELPADLTHQAAGSKINVAVPSVSEKTCTMSMNGETLYADASGTKEVTLPDVDAAILFTYAS